MARVRSVEFLPEIFQTPVNQQFLSSTLDQLVQEPKFIKTQGYIGRKIGPGVNANDKYVVEPSTERNDYQLEPGIIFRKQDTEQAEDAITYSGIIDTIRLAGGNVGRADRLTKSQYYNWDPFVDYDKLVNFSEYYWLPAGPDSVTVTASTRPAQSNIKVTRNSGFYTFDVEQGSNPTLTLVRGYNYTFNVTQNRKTEFQYRVTNRGSTAYVIDYQVNPNLTLVRGNTYQFNISTSGNFPFYIKTQPTTGLTNIYSRGVTNNGATSGIVSFTVPYDAPAKLYYAAENSEQMQGNFEVVDPGSGTGPGFWIQTDPGVDGRVAATPNISSRDVLGVVNNGEDFGSVTFNVPLKTAQNFYYTLDEIPAVDMICDLKFNQVNGAYVDDFLATYGGIDGITDLNTRTIVFPSQDPVFDTADAIEYGWTVDLGYGPFPTNEPEYVGEPGSYDVPNYATQTPIIPKNDRYVVWQILFQQDLYGATYMQLVKVREIQKYEKFSIRSGTEFASTSWFKNGEEYIEQIPLLSAVLDTLFYQDGANPGMFGQIRLIDQADSARLFIDDIIGKKQYTSPNGIVFTNGLKVQFRDEVFPSSYQNNVYFVEGVGTAITLLPVTNFISPEPFTRGALIPFDSLPFDVGNYDADQNQPLQLDYITINRASPDLNAWSRSNRWFHRQVLEQTAIYNGTVALLDQNYRAKRPIIEFRAGIKLFDFGTEGKQAVNIVDFQTTDALSTINGLPSYNIDGYLLTNGSRIIFAADTDPDVRNRVYEVELITPDTQSPLIVQPVINLVPASDAAPAINEVTVCLSGNTLQGRSFYFNGVTWLSAQLKSKINQAPLFDIFDNDGITLSDTVKYPSSTFKGSKLFSYATGTGANDQNLGFAIKYLTINNVGDIVFENNFYSDTFLYVVNRASVTENVSIGFVRDYSDRTTFTRLLGWQTSRSPSRPYQQFRFSYDGSPLLLDVRVIDQDADTLIDAPMPVLKVFAGSTFVPQTEYTYTRTDNTTTIRLSQTYSAGDIIEVLALADQISAVAFYEIPVNLENNPLNTNSLEFTLGTIRTHYNSIAQNLIDFRGPINGSNNSRDLGNIVPYGSVILQQSSPMTLPGLFLRNPEYNIFEAIAFNSDEYQKYKDMLMDTVVSINIDNLTVPEILTQAIGLMTEGRNSLSPFYWSDMLPAGALFETTTYTYTAISTPTFDTIQSYDFTSSNYRALNVYVNQQLLTRGLQYIVNPNEFNLTVLVPLAVGDVITIDEFSSTIGNFVPNTPTKMGLYPAYVPEIYVDNTYVNPTTLILGHDGSKTVAWGDIRDQVLLEFETRIFNNLKEVTPTPIPPQSVLPNFFRTTDYTAEEIQDMLNTSFLNWTGLNRLEYTEQEYDPDNPFTWNYSQAGNKLDGTPLQGAWRGIYLNFYSTITPHLTPWEMVGFSEQPTWWEARYGSAPFTSGNRVLWDDLEAGRIAEPGNDRIDPLFARPGLTQILPVDDQGNLLSPMDSIVGAYNPVGFRGSWQTGDYGPVEYSWRVSSAFPFALMRLEALTDPATFFSLYADRDLYRYNDDIGQFLYNNRYRLDANTIEVYGLGQSKASYINWIVDWSAANGNNTAASDIKAKLASIDVRLCYRMAGFSDKQYLKLFLEKPTPASTNTSLMLPDESFDLLLYKNQTSEEVFYSAVVIQKVVDGWKVFGYSENQPYFPILVSRPLGVLREISSGGTSVRVATQYTDEVVLVPYGYVFTNRTVVADFLLSYGALLARQGVEFADYENGYVLNWDQMVQEFLYWSQQGWGVDSIIVLNPSANKFRVTKEQLVANDISANGPFEQILDQNRVGIPLRDMLVRRNDNELSIEAPGAQAISYIKLGFSNFEHLMVLRNQSVFGDLVYNPGTGARQYRIALIGSITSEWNGQVDAQGFILNSDNIAEWQSNRRYTKGEIVKFKNNLWSALTIVQPKAQFDFNDWAVSDYNAIQKGLLPNLPNKADQLANSYDINNANLESDNDLLSYGLTGFRPRTYMAALDLNDVSQVNVYSQFLKSKGTIRSVDLLSNANFGKESADYQIYENWALLSGTYGAQANRKFVDLQLNAALLNPNPSIVQLVRTGESSLADQSFNIDNLWSQSSVITNPEIFPTINNGIGPQLPTAGYVNLDDVNITVYSLDDPSVLNPYLEQLGVGTTLWVAKVNAYDWNIYRCSVVPAQVIAVFDNLDQTSTVTFNAQHGLTVGQLFVIKNFNGLINGVYRVLTVPSLYEVSIEYTFPNDQQVEADGNGLAFKLQTVRVSQPSNIANLPFVNSIRSGAKVWVDNNVEGDWTVLEKRAPVVLDSEIAPISVDLVVEPNTNFAYSLTQRADNLIALVGRPDVDGERGQVINYLQTTNDPNSPRYSPARVLNLRDADNVINYGFSTTLGKNTWAAAGAPYSGNGIGYVGVSRFRDNIQAFLETQLLLALDQPGPCEFGYSVSMSSDERWLYVGAPAYNRVYAYGRQDVQNQIVTYQVARATSTFATTGIQFTNDRQLDVYLNDTLVYLGYDYIVSGTNVVFLVPVRVNDTVTIARATSRALDTEVFPYIKPTIQTGAGYGAEFTVSLVRGKYTATILISGQNYSVGEIITIPGTHFGGTSPLNDCFIEVTQIEGPGFIKGINVTGQFIPLTGLPLRFDISDLIYPLDDIGSASIYVDGRLQRPKIDYEYYLSDDSSLTPDSSATTGIVVIDFTGRPPGFGANISVETGSYYRYVDMLTVAGLPVNARFGESIACGSDGRAVVIGAPGVDVNGVDQAGTIYVFDRHVERMMVTNPATTTYTPNAGPASGLVAPTSVKVNATYLNNTFYYNGTGFTENNISVNITAPLSIGDEIEIETNQFELIQTIVANEVQEKSFFGHVVDFCPNNCSIYTGQPDYSLVDVPQCGSVQRDINQSRLYGVISSVNDTPVLVNGDTLRVNNYEVAVPNVAGSLRLAALATAIKNTVPNVTAEVNDDNIITINVINFDATLPGARLSVLPGAIGSAFYDLGFVLFDYAQTIANPVPTTKAEFGHTVKIDNTASILSVAAPSGDSIDPDTFDAHSTPYPYSTYNSYYVLDPLSEPRTPTTWDGNSTTFFDITYRSGVVYTYDRLAAYNGSITNPDKFVLGQQIRADSLSSYDKFGQSLSYVNNVFLIGAPGTDLGDSVSDDGSFYVFDNPNNAPSWQITYQQPPTVDVYLFNSISMYDRLKSTTNQFFDFFNPILGKMLGAIQSNLDYTSPNDPASYNQGLVNVAGNTWAAVYEGRIWWDTSDIRFIDPAAGDIKYAALRWGQIFPGSSVDIYQWTRSDVPPSQYAGPGTVYSIDSYTTWTEINSSGIVETVYYYWVKNSNVVAKKFGKTLSTEIIARYIEDPRSSGISYVAPLSPSALAIYNGNQYINASDTILHVEYDQRGNNDNVHQEFELLTEDQPQSFLNDRLYLKMIDSFSGQNASGAAVPDTTLSPAMRYGPEFNPRQSMFVDRYLALQNYITRANTVMAQYPVTESRRLVLLNSADPEPSAMSGAWDKRVLNLEQLSWENITIVPLGYRYLVVSDSSNANLWTIYTVTLASDGVTRELVLTRVQSWDVRKYWNYVDWYEVGYNSSVQPVAEVPIYADLSTLNVAVGSSVKVTANSQSKWEIYLYTDTGWQRVGLQDGTIAISPIIYDYALGRFGFDGEVFDAQYFDQTPQIETRKIIEAINQEIFIDDLAIERNRLMILMFNYILSEQEAPSWLLKTSLIDVTHRIRELLPYQTYRRDNQDFVLQYINEVKPYHTQIRQFNLQYSGNDEFKGALTDYDLPAYYDTSLTPPQYISPILVDLPVTEESGIQPLDAASELALNNPSIVGPNAAIWLEWPYSQWFNNYLLELDNIEVINGGSGYLFPPQVTIRGVAKRLGTATAVINSAGQVVAINIVDPGEGYYVTPTVILSSVSGTSATAMARMTNDLVRTFTTTLKYDRYQYQPNWEPWVPNDTYDNGTLVYYDGRVWQANSPDSSGVNTPTFEPSDWILVPAGELSGVDRTMAYYVSTVNTPGKELPLLIDGVDYPGVQIEGVAFDAATGFDSDPYDTYVFDNIQVSPEGLPTYSDRILDTIYNGGFFNDFIGTRATDVNVDGGAFIDTYSSYAPEELVPGSEFDTLDFRVYTTPGADWRFDGHGFPIANRRYEVDITDPTFNFANLLDYPVAIGVTNITTRRDLNEFTDYLIDWPTQTVTLINSVGDGDVLMLRVYGLGGGNQLYKSNLLGGAFGNSLEIPVQYSLIQELAIFVNGAVFTDYTYSELPLRRTLISFNQVLTDNDYVSITAIGVSPGTIPRSWSKPMSQYVVVTDPSQTTYSLSNYILGTNAPNIIVLKNGVRARPAQGIEYIADGSSEYFLPTRGGVSQGLISDPDVNVWVDNELQFQFSQYQVEPWDGSSLRTIRFLTVPPIGSRILISVSTKADYTISTSPAEISFRISSSFGLTAGDVLQFITWNDTSEQNIETRVWVGPVTFGTTLVEAYDSTPFSSGDILNGPGSFDYSAGTTTTVNDIDLRRVDVDPTRLWVTLNGNRLVNGVGYNLVEEFGTTFLTLPTVMSVNDVLVVELFTSSVVPGAMAFRIFQDMRGVQATYRITQATTTELSQNLYADDDVVHLVNAAAVGEPNIELGYWGVITVGAERIMYRQRNLADNTVSSLMRGTAGTAIANHATGTVVYDISRGNLLPAPYQDYVVVTTTPSDGNTPVFVAPNISIVYDDSTTAPEEVIRVTVGGTTLVQSDYQVQNVNPVAVRLATIPPTGVDVSISVLRGVTWYQPGIDSASDGRPLQETNTEAAKFLRGL